MQKVVQESERIIKKHLYYGEISSFPKMHGIFYEYGDRNQDVRFQRYVNPVFRFTFIFIIKKIFIKSFYQETATLSIQDEELEKICTSEILATFPYMK
jgi:hypothetical protein